MRTFHISTLGCKVNQYETEQIATLLRSRGLTPVDRPQQADLRIVNTCSVTLEAASKSRQTVRQAVRLPVLTSVRAAPGPADDTEAPLAAGQRVIVTGCWATSDKAEASGLPGVSAVIGHHDDVAAELNRLLSLWQTVKPPAQTNTPNPDCHQPTAQATRDNGWMILASAPAADSIGAKDTKARAGVEVNGKIEEFQSDVGAALAAGSSQDFSDTVPAAEAAPTDFSDTVPAAEAAPTDSGLGTRVLPQLDARQASHQRAFLKIQDGCDAHCTYCIIPRLRPGVWSKPVEAVVGEARRLVEAGHRELVLTGIFLGAYGQPTALRRRQDGPAGRPLARLVEALCGQVPGLKRLRLSSLEPGDLDDALIAALRAHPQCVPHFHLPLQSGCDTILRRMNRQYTRDDYRRMIDQVRSAFDRPAITTDIIVGFPGETEDAFEQTAQLAGEAGFIHIHAFPFSPRPGTAAARWTKQFVRGPVVHQRIARLAELASAHSLAFRRQFIGRTVELLVEHPSAADRQTGRQHGRCERYFPVSFTSPERLTGRSVRVLIEEDVAESHTVGRLVGVD